MTLLFTIHASLVEIFNFFEPVFSCLHKGRNCSTYLHEDIKWVMPTGAVNILSSNYLPLNTLQQSLLWLLLPLLVPGVNDESFDMSFLICIHSNLYTCQRWILWHESSDLYTFKFGLAKLKRHLLFKTKMKTDAVKAFCDVSSHLKHLYQLWLLIKNDPIWMLGIPSESYFVMKF